MLAPGSLALGAAALPVAAAAATSKTYHGSVASEMYGTVQVTITVSGKKVTKVTASAPADHPRSVFINQQAIPLLDREALTAQSARINVVSGATYTSDAFATSLAAALKAAHV
jgi:uncharacterized protein with FMN-binding domain